MNRVLVALAVVAAFTVASPGARAESGLEDCFVVRATADARNQQVSRDRAQHRLRRYIADHLSSPGGKSVGPTSVNCIRNACEATAIVCRH
ncbi:MAG: hypothetical protein WAL47_01030 [Pyrinomonadaceae bacterium]|jgi:hypothetical protein